MKKSISLLLAAALLFLCASCASTKAFVAGTEDYQIIPVQTNFFGNTITCGEYKLKMDSVKNGIKQVTVLGLGVKKGTMTQRGILYKNNVPVCSVSLNKSFDGLVSEGFNSTTSLGEEENSFVISMGNREYTYVVNPVRSYLEMFSGEEPFDFSMDIVDTIINSFGEIADTWWNSPVGAKISAFGEEYAVVDILTDSKQIRINPHFPLTLTESEENFLYALMLLEFQFETSFRNESTDSGFNLNIL